MKKIVTLFFVLTVCTVSAHAQLLGTLGSMLLKQVGEAAVTKVAEVATNKLTEKMEKKAESMMSKLLEGPEVAVEGTDSLGNPTKETTRMGGLTQMVSMLGSLQEQSNAAKTAELRDFSKQNALRKEHNQELTFDDWD